MDRRWTGPPGQRWRQPRLNEAAQRLWGKSAEPGHQHNDSAGPSTRLPDGAQAGQNLILREWRPRRQNTLRGLCVVELVSCGLVIRDVDVHEKNASRWANLPAKPMLDGNGVLMRNPAGKPQYVTLFTWRDHSLRDAFSRAVIDVIRRAHPDAFDA